MRIKVKLRLIKINDELDLEIEKSSVVRALLDKLLSTYGDNLKRIIGSREKGYRAMVMVNREMVDYDYELKDNDEVSLIIPIAGG